MKKEYDSKTGGDIYSKLSGIEEAIRLENQREKAIELFVDETHIAHCSDVLLETSKILGADVSETSINDAARNQFFDSYNFEPPKKDLGYFILLGWVKKWNVFKKISPFLFGAGIVFGIGYYINHAINVSNEKKKIALEQNVETGIKREYDNYVALDGQVKALSSKNNFDGFKAKMFNGSLSEMQSHLNAAETYFRQYCGNEGCSEKHLASSVTQKNYLDAYDKLQNVIRELRTVETSLQGADSIYSMYSNTISPLAVSIDAVANSLKELTKKNKLAKIEYEETYLRAKGYIDDGNVKMATEYLQKLQSQAESLKNTYSHKK